MRYPQTHSFLNAALRRDTGNVQLLPSLKQRSHFADPGVVVHLIFARKHVWQVLVYMVVIFTPNLATFGEQTFVFLAIYMVAACSGPAARPFVPEGFASFSI